MQELYAVVLRFELLGLEAHNLTEALAHLVGLRVVAGETAGYAHASEISEAAIARAADSAALAKRGYSGVAAEGPRSTNRSLYGEHDPLAAPSFGEKVALLQEIDAFAAEWRTVGRSARTIAA